MSVFSGHRHFPPHAGQEHALAIVTTVRFLGCAWAVEGPTMRRSTASGSTAMSERVAAVRTRGASTAHGLLEFVFRAKSLEIPMDRRDRQLPAGEGVRDGAIARVEAAVDVCVIPFLRVTDV